MPTPHNVQTLWQLQRDDEHGHHHPLQQQPQLVHDIQHHRRPLPTTTLLARRRGEGNVDGGVHADSHCQRQYDAQIACNTDKARLGGSVKNELGLMRQH